ncbi:MAG: phosphoglycerate dehydrogenase [Deltaproteobacteria bacterium]|nr:MAG: phosphoglycerate dehydrogenase [Deltaproteobacteria bacterium]
MSPRAAELLRASPRVAVDVRDDITAADLVTAIADYDALIVRSRTQVTREVIDAGARLKLIGRAGIGVDNIDVAAASRRGILVENTPGGNAVTTAEHALCLLMALARHIPQAAASMRAGKWEKKRFNGRELCGKTLGVIGLGNIGRIVADRARGLHMTVIGCDPFLSADAAARLGVELVDFDTLCARADFVTVHTPLTAATRGLIGAEALARMKPGVLIVNAARGGIVDEAALVDALERGHVGGAALDVFETEPPPPDHPLRRHERVVCTPHLGASTDEAQEKVAAEIAEQVVAFAERGEVRNAVNMTPVPVELREALAPWLDLARQMGRLVGQLAHGDGRAIDELTVEVLGELADTGAKACANAALVGLLGTFLDVPVNEVNAPLIAAERGLGVREVAQRKGVDYAAAVALTARAGDRQHYVKGTLYHIGGKVAPRIVQIDDFLVETKPRGRLLVVRNHDRPGVIGKVGTLLGDRSINVNSLHVGLHRPSGVAIALWNVDASVDRELVAAVAALPEVIDAMVVDL